MKLYFPGSGLYSVFPFVAHQKLLRPIRTMVAPALIAGTKSSLIPIDKVSMFKPKLLIKRIHESIKLHE